MIVDLICLMGASTHVMSQSNQKDGQQMNEQHGLLCHTLYGRGFGNVDSDVVLVGIAPGKQEERKGRPFVGPSGKFLDATLKAAGLDRESMYATNLVCYVNNEPDDNEIDLCWERFSREIKEIKPKVIMAFGVKPIEKLVPGYPASKTRGIAMWSQEFDCWVIGTWHPSHVLQQESESLARDLLDDIFKIPHYLHSSATRNMGLAPYNLFSDSVSINAWLASRNNSDFLTLDVETTYDGTKLRCFAMAQGPECIVVTNPMALAGQIDWPLDKNMQWTFQNGMFDVPIMQKFMGVTLPIKHDTMYMHYMLDERAGDGDENYDVGVGIHGLKKLAGGWCGSGLYDISTEDATDKELWPYNAKDAVYTYRLAHFLYSRLQQDSVERAYELTINAANKAWRSKQRGIYVDKKELAKLGHEWTAKWLLLHEKLQRLAMQAGWPTENFNPNSHVQLKKLIYDSEYMAIPVSRRFGKNTQAKTLEEYRGTNDFIDCHLEWKGINKDLSTYVRGTFDAIDDKGYIHPDPVLHATVTGRWAYKKPPMQTIPQARNVGEERARLRRVFTVESDDRELCEGDYSQSEVWWAAYYGNDKQMFADLRSGDYHGKVTEDVFKIDKASAPPDVWKKKRGDSKFVTFGVMFGRQKKALQKAEMWEYTVDEVGEFIERWYDRNQEYIKWRTAQQKLIRETGEQQSLSGHKRRYPIIFKYHAINQSFNFPVQCVSHANLMATYAEAFDILVEEWDAWILLEIHDALVVDYPKRHRDAVLGYIKEIAERDRFGLSIPMEFKIGQNLLDMKEIKVV